VDVEPQATTAPVEEQGYVEDANEILDLDDRAYEDVVVPEWDGRKFRVQSLTGEERDKLELSMLVIKRDGRGKIVSREQNLVGLRAKTIAHSVVRSDGSLLFSEAQALKLMKKNAAALQHLFLACQRLSALSDEDVAELVDEVKNDPSSDGGSV
jgi:hypothetical protein